MKANSCFVFPSKNIIPFKSPQERDKYKFLLAANDQDLTVIAQFILVSIDLCGLYLVWWSLLSLMVTFTVSDELNVLHETILFYLFTNVPMFQQL